MLAGLQPLKLEVASVMAVAADLLVMEMALASVSALANVSDWLDARDGKLTEFQNVHFGSFSVSVGGWETLKV